MTDIFWTLTSSLMLLAGSLAFRLARLPDISLVASASLSGALFLLFYEQSGLIAVTVALLAPIVVASIVFTFGVLAKASVLAISTAVVFLVQLPMKRIFALGNHGDHTASSITLPLDVQPSLIVLSPLLPILVLALIFVAGLTRIGLAIRVVCDMGPRSNHPKVRWSWAAFSVLVGAHLCVGLYGIQVAAFEGTVDSTRFDTLLLWMFLGIVLGDHAISLFQGHLGQPRAKTLRKSVSIGVSGGIVFTAVFGALAIGVAGQVVNLTGLRNDQRPAISFILAVPILVAAFIRRRRNTSTWEFVG